MSAKIPALQAHDMRPAVNCARVMGAEQGA